MSPDCAITVNAAIKAGATHYERADHRAALLLAADVCKFALYRARHLQVVRPEHADGEQDEKTREQDQDPRLIECRLQLHAGSGGGNARCRVNNSHAHDIAECEREATHR
jgi:hypothetical protein